MSEVERLVEVMQRAAAAETGGQDAIWRAAVLAVLRDKIIGPRLLDAADALVLYLKYYGDSAVEPGDKEFIALAAELWGEG